MASKQHSGLTPTEKRRKAQDKAAGMKTKKKTNGSYLTRKKKKLRQLDEAFE